MADLTVLPLLDQQADQPAWLVDAADLLAEPDPGPTAWLVQDLIVDQAIIAAVGRWKTTKSYGLLDLCISIATGEPAFGQLAIPNPGQGTRGSVARPTTSSRDGTDAA